MIGNGRRVYGGNGEHVDGRQWKMDDNGNDGNGRRVFDGNGDDGRQLRMDDKGM